jgi:hypothetical protein
MDVTTLFTAYDTSTGAVPIGDTWPASNGPSGYDVLYGGYCALLGSLVYKFAPTAINQYFLNQIIKALDWLNDNYSTEPLTTVRYTGTTIVSFEEVVMREVPGVILGGGDLLEGLRYTAAVQDPSVQRQGNYSEYGSVTGAVAAHGGRGFAADIFTEFYDIAPPIVNLTTPTTHRMSDESTKDSYSYSFTVDENITEWKIKLVSSTTDPHTAGTQLESGGAVNAGTPIAGSITYAELVAAGVGAEGTKVVKFFSKDSFNNWSE